MPRLFSKRRPEAGKAMKAKPASGFVLATDEDEIEPQWLLGDRRIPLGDVTVLSGNQGQGKSMLTAMLAAGLSKEHETSLILTTEDTRAVVKARVEFADGDWDHVHVLSDVRDGRWVRRFRVPQDIPTLEAMVEEHEAKLVVLDPALGFLGDGVNAMNAVSIREKVMGPLQEMARRTGAAVIVIVHTARDRGQSAEVHRVGASKAFTEVARSVLRFGVPEDLEDNPGELRYLVHVKTNHAQRCDTEVFRLVGSEDGSTARLVHVGFDPSVTTLARQGGPGSPRRSEAEVFLTSVLADGPRTVEEVTELAAEAGIRERTLKRARQRLGVVTLGPVGFGGKRRWRLPG